jgi:serine/threonine protein phosphatase PrpC
MAGHGWYWLVVGGKGARASMEDCHIATPLSKQSHVLYAAVFDGHGTFVILFTSSPC